MTCTHLPRGTRLLALMVLTATLGGCKTRPVSGPVVYRKSKTADGAQAPTAQRPAGMQTPQGVQIDKHPSLTDERYVKFVRPLFAQHRCDAQSCHGNITFAGGMYLSGSIEGGAHDYRVVLKRIDRKEPEKSLLVQKVLTRVPHNGGKNFDEKSCDMQRLLAWIGERPDPGCTDPPPPDVKARFARETAPALVAMGCVDSTCHGGEQKARSHMDLSELLAKEPRMELPLQAVNLTTQNHLTVYSSAMVRAADATDGVHKRAIDKFSCAYRRLYGFIARSPELTCDLADDKRGIRQRGLPSLAGFVEHVVPVIQRRGCGNNGCHGNAAGDLPLFPNLDIPEVPMHDYLVLTSRVEDFAHLDQSTLLRTARNIEPHGGGKRLGGKGDCFDDILTTWLSGKVPTPCPPPQPPSYERYVKEIQPVLDHMTCTNPKCHGSKTIAHFILHKGAKTEKELRWNFSETARQIDPDFMPFSQVQLRMREPCAYTIVAAWIENKPKPTCTMGPPDPNAFPKRDDDGNIVHPTAMPGPPPTKS